MAQFPPLPPLGEALKALAASEPAPSEAHPPLAALVAYREGTLPEDEAEALREHLVLCPECAEQLLDLAAFEEAEPPLGEKPLSDADVAASWEKLKKRLPDGPPAGGVLSFFRHTRYALPLAACLVLSVAGAFWWMARIQAARWHDPDSVTFEVGQPGTRGPEETATRSAARPLTIYARGIPREVRSVRLEIVKALVPEIVWQGKEQPRAGDPVELDTLPRKELEPGAYRVLIYGDDRAESLGSFSLILD